MSNRSLSSPSALIIALAGAVSLAAAMGLGRFAFTPLLPLMVHDGWISLREGSWLATLNYIGYWLGALGCMLIPWLWSKRKAPSLPQSPHNPNRMSIMLFSGLCATVLLLFCMALPWPALWAFARLGAGIASAVAFVYTTAWCLEQLAKRDANRLGGFIFTGPGIGIAVSGLLASKMALWNAQALTVWAIMGIVATLLSTWVVSVVLRAQRTQTASSISPAHQPTAQSHIAPEPSQLELLLLTIGYSLAGFGYIITATYLPVIALDAVPNSPWIPLFWPVFGLCIAIGAASTRLIPDRIDRRWLLMACYVIQAIGVAAPLLMPSSLGFVLGSALLGLPFTTITLFAFQEARRLKPHNATGFIGGLTALYGVGQIAGPPLVVWLLSHSTSQHQGFIWALAVASSSLVIGAFIFAWMLYRYRIKHR